MSGKNMNDLFATIGCFLNKNKKYLPYVAIGLALVLVLLIVLLVFVDGGSQEIPENSSSSTNQDITDDQDKQETPDNNETDQKEEVKPYTNPLNGEPLAEPYLGRPVAVMLNNIKQAMPQHGVSQADILYEVLAEGGITRCMGIYSDISKVDKVGSIRSSRKYYVEIAQGYNAIYVHFGGSQEALNYLKTLKGVDLDGQRGGKCFVQDKDRLKAGYSSEHTWFAVGPSLLEHVQGLNYQTSYDSQQDYGMVFDDEKVIAGESNKKITVYFNKGGNPGAWTKSTSFTYDAATKQYSAAQHGGNYIDGNTKKTITFRNVVVLKMPTVGDYYQNINTLGTGTGYYSANGQTVSIKWSRETVNDPFTYTLEDGSPLTFSAGATYIGVVPTNATITFE